jgi:hypothetical protein
MMRVWGVLLVLAVLGWPVGAQDAGLSLPARQRITVANAETVSLYMVQAKRAERVLWSPGGMTLAVLDGADIDLYRVADWLATPVRIRLDQAPADLAFSPDGQLLYVAVPGTVLAIDITTGARAASYLLDAKKVVPSRDGLRLAWVARSGRLEVFTLLERTSVLIAEAVEDAVLTPDGRRVIAALADGSAVAYDLSTRQPERTYAGEGGAFGVLHAVGQTDDGRQVVLPAAGGAGLRVFRAAEPDAPSASLTLPSTYTRINGWGVVPRLGWVTAAAIASAPEDSAVVVWGLSGGVPVTTLRHPGVRDAMPSPDGSLIASVGGGALRLWAVGASVLTVEQARSISAVNVVAACNAVGGAPRLGEVLGGQRVSLVWSWYAATPQQVRDYLDVAQFQLTFDGQVVRPWVFVTQTAPDPINDGNPTVYLYAPIGVVAVGAHTSAVQVTWVRPINDGFADYGPNTANPSDGGACDFTAS